MRLQSLQTRAPRTQYDIPSPQSSSCRPGTMTPRIPPHERERALLLQEFDLQCPSSIISPGDPYAHLSQGAIHSFAPSNFSCPFTHVVGRISRTYMTDLVKGLGDAPVSGPLYAHLTIRSTSPRAQTWRRTRRLSKELGLSESLGWMQATVHTPTLERSRRVARIESTCVALSSSNTSLFGDAAERS